MPFQSTAATAAEERHWRNSSRLAPLRHGVSSTFRADNVVTKKLLHSEPEELTASIRGRAVYSRNRERPLVDGTDIDSDTYPRQKLHIGIDKPLAMTSEVDVNCTILDSLVNSWPVDGQLAAVILNV